MQGSRRAWPILPSSVQTHARENSKLPVVSKSWLNSGLDAGQLLSGSLVPECASIATPHRTQTMAVVAAMPDQISLLTHHAHHCRAAVDHVEFKRRRAAHVDNSTTTIRPAIGDADDDSLAIANVGHQHPRAKRQCPMSSSKPGPAGYFAACGPPAAIECGTTAFGVNRTDRYR